VIKRSSESLVNCSLQISILFKEEVDLGFTKIMYIVKNVVKMLKAMIYTPELSGRNTIVNTKAVRLKMKYAT